MFLYISCSKTFDTHIIRSDDIGFPYVYRKKIGGSALTPNQHLPIYLQYHQKKRKTWLNDI